ncbi:MAG: hypothetical protein K9M56_06625 [Victivallales bacterium]|nr:hypothetical protein [Victivallales bacterium]
MLIFCKMSGKFFTLVEIIVSLSIFSLLSATLISVYQTAFSATNSLMGRSVTFENTRITLDLITRDLQTAYYDSGKVPFWHWKPDGKPASWGVYRNELLAFIASTGLKPNKNCKSSLCEVKYQLYYATNPKDSKNGWIRRSVTGDYTSTKKNKRWNIYSDQKAGYTTDSSEPVSTFTANSNSSEYYYRVMPYVTMFSFTCYDKKGNIIEPDKTISKEGDACSATVFPFSVDVTIKTMDKESWNKWLDLFAEGDYPDCEPVTASSFRKKHERTFTKTVYLGERG